MIQTVRSPNEMRKLAHKLSSQIRPGMIVGLTGELGSGKTVFVKGLAEGLGVGAQTYITSPTYSIVHEYACSKAPLVHMDFYRIKSAPEVYTLDLNRYLACRSILAIEWIEQVPSVRADIMVCIDIVSATKRSVSISPHTGA